MEEHLRVRHARIQIAEKKLVCVISMEFTKVNKYLRAFVNVNSSHSHRCFKETLGGVLTLIKEYNKVREKHRMNRYTESL